MPSRSYLQRLVGRDRVPQAVLTPPRSLFAPRSHLLANNDIASFTETRPAPLPSAAGGPAGEAPPPGTTRRGRGGPAETVQHHEAVAPVSTGRAAGEPERGPRNRSRPAVERSIPAPIGAQAHPAARATPSTAPMSRRSVQTSAKPAHEPSREHEPALPQPDAGRRSGFQPMSSPVGEGAPPPASTRGRGSVSPPPRPPQRAARDERPSATPSDSVPRHAASGRSAANTPVSRAGDAKPRRTDARDALSPLPPPRAAAHRASDAPQGASQSAAASIRIGSLEVRVVAPQPAAQPAAAPPPGRAPVAPAKAPAAPLARGFRRFGLAQA